MNKVRMTIEVTVPEGTPTKAARDELAEVMIARLQDSRFKYPQLKIRITSPGETPFKASIKRDDFIQMERERRAFRRSIRKQITGAA